MTGEPQIHSHITDILPTDHRLAFTAIYCGSCKAMLHAFNNECMTTWVESGLGNFCLACFAALPDSDALEDEAGLPIPAAASDK
jgi:hypothetical protein